MCESIDGWGRVSVVGGYRWTPNWYFNGRAADLGYPVTEPSIGGPALTASFGYGAASFLELSIDGFLAWERFTLDGLQPFNSFSYGGGIGGRLAQRDVFFRGFTPWVALEVGPLLAIVQSPSLPTNSERALGALFVAGGFHLTLSGHWALTFEVRYIYARAVVPEIAGINVGGVVFSLGVTSFFPPSTKRELDVPGFTSPSNL